VLPENKALTPRKWLADSILKRKAEGFTILGILNPEVASKQDSQTFIEIFDGIIEIYEKELRERARRFLMTRSIRKSQSGSSCVRNGATLGRESDYSKFLFG